MLVGSAIFLSPSVFASLEVMKDNPEPLISAQAFYNFPWCLMVTMQVHNITVAEPVAALHSGSVSDTRLDWTAFTGGEDVVDGCRYWSCCAAFGRCKRL